MTLRIKKPSIKARQSVNLFIAGLLLLPIYIDLMGNLSEMIGFSTKTTTYIYYGLLWILLVMSIPKIAKAFSTVAGIGILFVVWVLSQALIFPENRDYLAPSTTENLLVFGSSTLVEVVPYILIGLAVTDLEALAELLHKAARMGVFLGMLSYMIAIKDGQALRYDDMSNAYAICAVVCILITNYQKNDIYFVIMGFICLFLAGTRGPLLCACVAVLMKVFLLDSKSVKKAWAIFLLVIGIMVLQSDLAVDILELVENAFEALGVKSLRIVDYFESGKLLDSSGRDDYHELIIEHIWTNPLFGYGVGGDRLILGRSYVHNILLEMWVSYGILLGTAILGWMGYWLLKALRSKNMVLASLATALFCSVVVKLFLSSSYLYAKELFVLIGICISGVRAQKCNGRMDQLND